MQKGSDNNYTDKEKIAHRDETISKQDDRIAAQDAELAEQQEAITNLQHRIDSSQFDLPILKIADEILMVPLVGAIDSVKSQKTMENILENIRRVETKVVVIDIAGITIVDSSVAAHLIKIAKATRLMGARAVISGLSPLIAQNIVNLGVDTSDVETTNTLQDAMRRAYEYVGIKLVEIE